MVVDEEFQKKIEEVTNKLRGNELKILDDFCQAYCAAKMLMTGEDFMAMVNEVRLNIQTFFKDGQYGIRYWFDFKEEEKQQEERGIYEMD